MFLFLCLLNEDSIYGVLLLLRLLTFSKFRHSLPLVLLLLWLLEASISSGLFFISLSCISFIYEVQKRGFLLMLFLAFFCCRYDGFFLSMLATSVYPFFFFVFNLGFRFSFNFSWFGIWVFDFLASFAHLCKKRLSFVSLIFVLVLFGC